MSDRLTPDSMTDAELWRCLWNAADLGSDAGADLFELYLELEKEVKARAPMCWSSGKCCHFEAYGHRLYVTGLEIAYVLQQWLVPKITAEGIDPKGDCPFHQDNLCGAHQCRPMGCRIFYCQAGTQDWQKVIYEKYHQAVRGIHVKNNVPYRYLEWRAGLKEALTAMPEIQTPRPPDPNIRISVRRVKPKYFPNN